MTTPECDTGVSEKAAWLALHTMGFFDKAVAS